MTDNIKEEQNLEETPSINLDELEGLRGDGKPRWYVIHTYSGHENKVKISIEKMTENRNMQHLIQKVEVPTMEEAVAKDGKVTIKTKKMFPGYVVVKMIVTNQSWYLVRNTQGVTGFIGHGSNPIPLTPEEVRRMGLEQVDIDLNLKVGDHVKIINWGSVGQRGYIKDVNNEKQTAKVKIYTFENTEPLVDLNFSQIDKIEE